MPLPEDQARSSVTAPLPIKPAGGHFAGSEKKPEDDRRGDAGKKPDGDPERKPRRRGRLVRRLLLGIVLLVGIAYGAGVAVFSNIYYPGTTIAGADVSLVDSGSAAARIRSSVNRYTLTVEGAGFSWQYAPEDPDELISASAAAEATLAQNEPFKWPVRLYEAVTAPREQATSAPLELGAEPDFSLFASDFDRAGFEESLGAAIDAFNEGRSGTFDAASAYDAEQGAFTVERARSNEKLNRDNIIALAELALSRLDATVSLDALGADAFVPLNGSIDDAHLESVCEGANQLLGTQVTFQMGGTEVASIDNSTVAQWIVFDEALNASIDQEAAGAWAQNLAKSLTTVGTERTYTREDGKEVTVSGGTFGWSVDADTLTQLVLDAVTQKQTGSIDVPCAREGDRYGGAGARDWGAYIDIDISEQHARYYDANGNVLWESNVITGNPNQGNSTPTGAYRLRARSRDVTLIGKKDPETGEPEYETPVSYWMPFIGSAVGLHDASWQSDASFNDRNAFRSVGSHGCVNLPPAKAQELFDMVSVGVCVVVHY
ncbi:L,D-transpeptidase family protein [Enorma burkinafasonensis]|uniref:L,D-transpeptidase family protein n=1 Tax=Enorma burkinafasonensis TaxID=2590867 RepID=UPI001643A57A|nr:L,D-transpeptidase family protein [Enorma burkinafasonensis]